ncbi:hypothetical protein [Gordonia malaquae]|uniref:hypothetical protein n=1 Tax=Gordonia malaquae TaxID=410332 RepID=UPI00301634BB
MAFDAQLRYTAARHDIVDALLRHLLVEWGRRAPADPQAWMDKHAPTMAGRIAEAQAQLIGISEEFVPAVLAEQRTPIAAVGEIDASSLVGVDGQGLPIDSLLATTLPTVERKVQSLVMPDDAAGQAASQSAGWAAGALDLVTKVRTLTSDTSRVATGLHTIARPGVGYTRRLVGASCPRCVVLAGRVYKSSHAFDRHPRCDCEHVPAAMRNLDARTIDPRAHFDSLSEAEQDRIFTKAGARAIREGADISQVVNARRGAGLGPASGQRLTDAEAAEIRNGTGKYATARDTTTEGMTKRGLAHKSMRAKTSKKLPRLMPETIYRVAGDDDGLAREMLQFYGYMGKSSKKVKKVKGPAGGAGGGGGGNRNRGSGGAGDNDDLPIDTHVTAQPGGTPVDPSKVLTRHQLEEFGKVVADDEHRWDEFLVHEKAIAEWLLTRKVPVLSVRTFKEGPRTRQAPDAVTQGVRSSPVEFKKLNPDDGITFNYLSFKANVRLIAQKCRRGVIDARGTDGTISSVSAALKDAIQEHGVNLDEVTVIINGADGLPVAVGWRRGQR